MQELTGKEKEIITKEISRMIETLEGELDSRLSDIICELCLSGKLPTVIHTNTELEEKAVILAREVFFKG